MLFIIFILGALLGSSMGAFIHRRENIKDFIFGRSHCESCHYTIPLYLNIPLISYVLLRGKCRNCKEKIPLVVPAYEAVTAVVFCLLYLKYGISGLFLIRAVQSVVLLTISFTDLRSKEVYTLDIFALFVLELVHNLAFDSDLIMPFVNMVLLLVVYYSIYKLSSAMGEADVLLGAVSGFFAKDLLGAFAVFRNAFVLASIFSIILLVFRRKNLKDDIAFCPYIAMSILGVML
ncbi:MAG: prepilin peptidase [Peptoniphilus sp.]|nr:prepilin peptidase [Peptoniphilus sp.]